MKKKIGCASVMLLGFFVVSSEVQAASFDCAKAGSKVEQMICSDKALFFYDERLNYEYKSRQKESSDQGELTSKQREWLKEIRNSCNDTQCLLNAYTERIESLAEQPKDDDSFMDSPVIVGCDKRRGFVFIQSRSQSDSSFYQERGYKISELQWDDLEIIGNKLPNNDIQYRKGSKTRTQSCGNYKIEIKYGYLNDDPLGYQGFERFPEISIHLGTKTLVRSLPIGYDSILAECPDGNPMRLFVYPTQIETSPQIYIEQACFDKASSKRRRNVLIR